MPINLELAERVRAVLPLLRLRDNESLGETKMFGGLCFTLNGKMLVGIDKGGRIVVRISDTDFERELTAGRVSPMDFTGRPLRNFAFVPTSSFETDDELVTWISSSADYVRAYMLTKGKEKK